MVTKFLKQYFPGIHRFIAGFFNAMDNESGAHSQSLRKWLAVGFFWLLCVIVIRYTDATNIIAMATILTSMITALVITYTVGNIKERKIDTTDKPLESKPTDEQPTI